MDAESECFLCWDTVTEDKRKLNGEDYIYNNTSIMRLAAILTCHNRKDKTMKCLNSLFSVESDCDVFLTDDGCDDGTPQAVVEKFPNVRIIKGNGSLFWSRGMYTAWVEAVKGKYDFYLWLNDDIELYPNFIDILFESYNLAGKNCIVSGLIGNIHNKTEILYGGSDKDKKLIGISKSPQNITFMNGNVVLVPKFAVNKIGILDPKFHHDLGDVDYGLTANENGIRVVTTTSIVALGYPNNHCRIRKWNTNIFKRFKILNSPLGSPVKINFYFRQKHFGLSNAIAFCLYEIVLNLLPDKIVSLLWGSRYMDK